MVMMVIRVTTEGKGYRPVLVDGVVKVGEVGEVGEVVICDVNKGGAAKRNYNSSGSLCLAFFVSMERIGYAVVLVVAGL